MGGADFSHKTMPLSLGSSVYNRSVVVGALDVRRVLDLGVESRVAPVGPVARIIYIRFNSKLPYLLHRIKNHNNEAANQKLFVETFGHLYEIYEASIDDATNKSAIFWSFCQLIFL